jgi:hypothetical protein
MSGSKCLPGMKTSGPVKGGSAKSTPSGGTKMPKPSGGKSAGKGY